MDFPRALTTTFDKIFLHLLSKKILDSTKKCEKPLIFNEVVIKTTGNFAVQRD